MIKKTIKSTTATATIKVGAPDGIVWCKTCLTVRMDDGTLTPTCLRCGGPWMLTEQIDVSNLSDDVKVHRANIEAKMTGWGLKIPPNVDIALLKAEREENRSARYDLIMKAYIKADNAYYAAWANGDIKDKKTKMPEDVKQMFREKRNKLPAPQDIEPLMKVSLAAVKRADPVGVRQLYFEVYGAEAGSNITIERMRASILEALRELMDTGKKEREEEAPGEREASQAALVAPNPPKPKKEAKKKQALYDDKTAQADKEAKWPWVKPGSWRPDPEHVGGTILDIICTLCGAERTIHAADAFQVKMCTGCKKTSKSKPKEINDVGQPA